MTKYAVWNGELADMLKDSVPRPKLRLILRARAKAPMSVFVNDLAGLYRQFGESLRISISQHEVLEQIADKPAHMPWRRRNR